MQATQYPTGETVEIRSSHAKCHNFEGGWNGFSFYTDSKGVLYATKNPPSTFSISLERMLSE